MKIGIEIHQQLDTRKLFCPCESKIRDERPDYTISRKQRAVLSEIGKLDPAAMEEMKKDRSFLYEGYKDLCLVELDEEPPHEMNREALEIALQIAFLLNAKPVEEMHVMRKTVVDGSNTSGFQRTALIATGGYIETKDGRIGIQTICIEEDAAKIIEKKDSQVTYRLDRLGIPLVEISTSPDIKTPTQAMEVAREIGNILRSVKIKRGLGTIRQDLNISVSGAERTEIKGVQELESIPQVAQNEADRQNALIEIKKELAKRKARAWNGYKNITQAFEGTNSKIMARLIKQGVIYGARLEGFKGLLGKEINPGRRFGTELSDYAKSQGASGLFHSDELPAYGISQIEMEDVKKLLEMKENDAFIMVGGSKETAERAIKAAIERAEMATKRVPGETRCALKDRTSRYMRPIPGAARMYPETDVPMVKTPARIKKPELIDKRIERICKRYGLQKETAKKLIDTARLQAFENAVKTGINPMLASVTLTAQLSALSREGVRTDLLNDTVFDSLFKALAKKRFAKEAIQDMLKLLAQGKTIEEAIKEAGLGEKADLDAVIEQAFKEKPELVQQKAFKPLMGIVMQKLRGKVDGNSVAQALKKKIGQ